jgi:hypothetical protein
MVGAVKFLRTEHHIREGIGEESSDFLSRPVISDVASVCIGHRLRFS